MTVHVHARVDSLKYTLTKVWITVFSLAFPPTQISDQIGFEKSFAHGLDAKACYAPEINWGIIVVANKKVWENKQTIMVWYLNT